MAETRTDAELVVAARSGDEQAFAAIYDRYADRIYGLCTTVTRDRGIAEDATAETFLSAWNRLEQLREPAQLRAWLFAIARNRAIKLGTRAAKLVPTDTVADTVSTEDTTAAIGADADATELQQMVWDAAEGLNPPERAVLDLQVRQGLEESEIAQVMGITLDHTYVLTSRMRAGLEKSMAALFIARKGCDDCDALKQVLAGWDGTYSPLIRKRVNRHIDQCETCEEKKKRVNPFAVLAGAPAFAAPFALRQRVLGDLRRVSFSGDWKADANGFPEASPGTTPRIARPWLLGAAAILMIIIGIVGFVAANQGTGSSAADAPATTRAPTSPTAPSATTTTMPAVVEESTAAAPTTTTRPTTTSEASTTTAAPDTNAPVITGASATPARISKAECRTSPNTITVTVTATDDRGIAGGTVSASIGGAMRGSAVLGGSGSSWSGTIGPFSAGTPSGSITLTIRVVDNAGNAATTMRYAQLAATCI